MVELMSIIGEAGANGQNSGLLPWVELTALMGAFGVGMSFAFLGSISVKLMPRLKIDTGRFGSLVSALMITAVISSIVVGLGIDKWGHKPFAIIGFLLTGASILVIARSTTFKAVFAACLFLGIGAMCMSNFGNTLIPEVLFDGEREIAALNLGNVAFGLGLFFRKRVLKTRFPHCLCSRSFPSCSRLSPIFPQCRWDSVLGTRQVFWLSRL